MDEHETSQVLQQGHETLAPQQEHAVPEEHSAAVDVFADEPEADHVEPDPAEADHSEPGPIETDLLIAEAVRDSPHAPEPSVALKAVIEAAIYITDEPLTAGQIAAATGQPLAEVQTILSQLLREYASPERGLAIREIAGGYKMSTKAEYHEPIRQFVRKLQAPLKLSLAALETLAVIAYKQPITGPEILEIRGVQGAGVVKTLLDRKLIVTAGRKNVLGKPMLYKTSRDFLVQFGLNSLTELPTLKEFEELGRMALSDAEEDAAVLAANPANTPHDGPQDAEESRESAMHNLEPESLEAESLEPEPQPDA